MGERDEYDALPEPGELQAWVFGPWLALYLNLGDPSDPNEELSACRAAFTRLHPTVSVVEVVE